MVPVRLKQVAVTGPGEGSKADDGLYQDTIIDQRELRTLQTRPRILVPKVNCTVGACIDKREVNKFVLVTKGRRDMYEPQVLNVPCTGWNAISLTANTND
jgi:hypothetical protein